MARPPRHRQGGARAARGRRERAQGAMGGALLAAVTLDGVPENLALGVSLVDDASLALLVAIFFSNLPEALVGSVAMRAGGLEARKVIGLWVACAVLLALAVVAGRGARRAAEQRGPGGRAGLRRRRGAGLARRHAHARGVRAWSPLQRLRHRRRVLLVVHARRLRSARAARLGGNPPWEPQAVILRRWVGRPVGLCSWCSCCVPPPPFR